jgi:electron transport complex protein RnfA
MKGITLILLVIFSAFNMNLTLQCALGIKGAGESRNCSRKSTFINLCVIFFAVIFLWLFFTVMSFLVIEGIFIYIMIFPVSFLAYEGIQYLSIKYIIKNDIEGKSFVCFPGGITAAAVFVCFNIASNFLEAVTLSFGFTSGIMVVFLIIREIRRRAALEAVPQYLGGNPLILISMGLLSLVFSTASLLIFRMIGTR